MRPKKKKLLRKVRDLIRSMTKSSDDYYGKIFKIELNLDDELPLIKMIEIHSMIIVVRSVFHENSKYYPQVFLLECLYNL